MRRGPSLPPPSPPRAAHGAPLEGTAAHLAVAARGHGADQGLRPLEMLGHAPHGGPALQAPERAGKQLRADLGRAGDRAGKGGQAADLGRGQRAQAVDVGQAGEGDPELAGDVVLWALGLCFRLFGFGQGWRVR